MHKILQFDILLLKKTMNYDILSICIYIFAFSNKKINYIKYKNKLIKTHYAFEKKETKKACISR